MGFLFSGPLFLMPKHCTFYAACIAENELITRAVELMNYLWALFQVGTLFHCFLTPQRDMDQK